MPDKNGLQQKVKKIQTRIGICFRRSRLLTSALTHSSYTYENPDLNLSNYERLEFFGDAVLNLIICEKLFEKFPAANEGLLSRLRSILVSKKLLARVAEKISLHRFIVVGRGEECRSISVSAKVLADVLEAVIGALYLDRGMKVTATFVCKHWRSYFDAEKLHAFDPNPKSSLQEYSQKTRGALPVYRVEKTRTGFRAHVSIGTRSVGKGKGTSKQEAEEAAADELLSKIKTRKRHSRFGNKPSKSDIPVSTN